MGWVCFFGVVCSVSGGAQVSDKNETNRKEVPVEESSLVTKKTRTIKAQKKTKPKPKKPVLQKLKGPLIPETKPVIVQKEISQRVVSLANRLDAFFGEKRSDDEKNGSTLRVIPSYKIEEFQNDVPELEIRFNLKLLNLERGGRAIEERLFSRRKAPGEDEELDPELAGEQEPEDLERKAREAREQEEWGWNYNFDNRIIVKNPVGLYSKIRIRKNLHRSTFTHRFYNEFGWSSDQLWQELASFSSDKELSLSLLFRFANEINWLLSANNITSSHGPSFIKSINARTSISYDFRINGIISGINWTLDNYRTGVNFRRQSRDKWIYYDINPAVTFDRDYGFQRALSLFIRFEFVFGDT